MKKRIVIIQGHPDAAKPHLCHAIANAYAEGAKKAGHNPHILPVAELSFPLLTSEEEFNHGDAPPVIGKAQQMIQEADHLVMVYPLWLGSMPAILKGFLEQLFRPGFAFNYQEGGGSKKLPKQHLKGKSARIIITMGMPSLVYRWFYCAHSLKSLKRNILGFCGIAPVRHTLIGGVEALNESQRSKKLHQINQFGQKAV